jgi:membrane-associated phospholipid phosphatase
MKTLKRFVLLIILLLVECLYFPLNRFMVGGTLVRTALDAYVPFLPGWAVIYVLCFPLWVGMYAWAGYKMEDDRLFTELWLSSVITFSIGLTIFVVFPTYIQRPPVNGVGWAANLVRYIYEHDRVYNAFPSAHVYITTLIALFYTRWRPNLRIAGIILVVLVSLSTVFSGQHSIIDPFGGVALAFLGYWLGIHLVSLFPESNAFFSFKGKINREISLGSRREC